MGFKAPRIVGDMFNPIQATTDAFKTTENVVKAKSITGIGDALIGQFEGPHAPSSTNILNPNIPFENKSLLGG